MEISDTSPERRNLTVLSVLIIIFYLGGAKLSANELTLSMVSVTFTNLEALQVALWASLVWLIYRYWQAMRFEGYSQILSDMASYHDCSSVLKFAVSRVRNEKQQARIDIEGVEATTIFKWQIVYRVMVTHQVKNGTVEPVQGAAWSSRRRLAVEGAGATEVWLSLFWRAALFRPGLTTYGFPYLLALTAMLLGSGFLIDLQPSDSGAGQP